MITRADLQPIRDQLHKARIILSMLPRKGKREIEAADRIESAVGQIDELIARPTMATLYATRRAR